LAWADFNRDGRPDLARQFRGEGCDNNLCDGNKWGDRCEAWRNDGSGNFTSVFSRIGGDHGDMGWTDSDMDGYADISFTGYALMYPGYPTTTRALVRGSATALNGGDDYELLFTVPLELQEQIMRLGGIDVIGHITAADTGAALVTPDGNTIALQAQGIRL
jgi:hypothetical protein